jgi:hypothetical protein
VLAYGDSRSAYVPILLCFLVAAAKLLGRVLILPSGITNLEGLVVPTVWAMRLDKAQKYFRWRESTFLDNPRTRLAGPPAYISVREGGRVGMGVGGHDHELEEKGTGGTTLELDWYNLPSHEPVSTALWRVLEQLPSKIDGAELVVLDIPTTPHRSSQKSSSGGSSGGSSGQAPSLLGDTFLDHVHLMSLGGSKWAIPSNALPAGLVELQGLIEWEDSFLPADIASGEAAGAKQKLDLQHQWLQRGWGAWSSVKYKKFDVKVED